MPELPEVETVRRGLEPVMAGAMFEQVLQHRADLRFPFPERFAERLTGARIEALRRRAKYLLADLSTGETLLMHLGMSGRFTVEMGEATAQPGVFYHAAGQYGSHDHVVFLMSGGARIIYNDARRFGFMALIPAGEGANHLYLKDLGVEPLGNDFHADLLDAVFDGKSAPLKAALLDQRLIAGLGNIYVCEALHRSGLAPTRPAGTLAGPGKARSGMRERLAVAIRDVLAEAVEAGGSTLRDYAQTDGSLGYFQHAFRVYDREGLPCPTAGCQSVILRMVQSGRSTFYCPSCQK